MKEFDLINGRVSIMKRTVEETLSSQGNPNKIEEILNRHQVRFSNLSLENIIDGIQIFNEIKTETPFAFIIYGSTSRGDAGKYPKVQELQFWNNNIFRGSIFRRHGVSDLDLRCVASAPQEVYKSLYCFKDSPTFAKNPVGIRIDSLIYANEEIIDTSTISFYRRIFFLNNPIILSGRNIITDLIDIGLPYLNSNDISYECELRQSKKFLASVTKDNNVIFINNEKLSAKFPKFYNSRYLSQTNFQRSSAFKISFGARESSLMSINIENDNEIENFINAISLYPGESFKNICEYAKHDN